jgi:hypothetical protein
MGRDIVKYVVQKALKRKCSAPRDKYCETMRRVVEQVFSENEKLFDSFIVQLNLNVNNGYQGFISVSDEIFREGDQNWGRVVILYAFAAYVARHSAENDKGDMTTFIGDFLGYYVVKTLGPWIHDNGGWVGIQFECKF